MRTASLSLFLAAIGFSAACSPTKPATDNAPRTPPRTRVVHDTVRDSDLERRVARLELRAIEKETQVDELQTRLEDTREIRDRIRSRIEMWCGEMWAVEV